MNPARTIAELAEQAEWYGMLDGSRRRGVPGAFVMNQPNDVREALKKLTSRDVSGLLPLSVRKMSGEINA